jgi:colanic acid/amylovoran biosynthesis glycosyltransferase
MQLLILLTSCFPYGHGEVFLENEIPELSKAFDKIFIIPCATKNEKKTIRPVPKNVSVIELIVPNNLQVVGHFPYAVVLSELLFIFPKLSFYKCKVMVDYAIKTIGYKLTIKSLLKHLNKKETEKIILYSYWLDEKAVAAAIMNCGINIVAVSRAHRWEVYEELMPEGYLPFRKLLAEKLNRIYFISNDGFDYFKNKKYSNNNKNLKLSRLGVKEANVLNPSNAYAQINIVSCSTLIKRKRVDLMVDVAKYLANRNINFVWTHIGDGEECISLKKKVASYQIENNFIFLGQKNNQFILDFYSNNPVDLFVNLSDSEGVPVSIMEAISYGIPCLALDCGGNNEIVINKVSGILLPLTAKCAEISTSIINFIKLTKENNVMLRISTFNFWKENYNANTNYSLFIEDLTSFLN